MKDVEHLYFDSSTNGNRSAHSTERTETICDSRIAGPRIIVVFYNAAIRIQGGCSNCTRDCHPAKRGLLVGSNTSRQSLLVTTE